MEFGISHKTYNNATILIKDRFFHCSLILDNGVSIPLFNELQYTTDYLVKDSPLYCNQAVIFIGLLHNIWGHCLTDSLKKIWVLQTEECKRLIEEGAKVVYLEPKGEPLKPHAIRLLQMAGVDVSSIEPIRHDTRFRTIYFPENSLVCQNSSNKNEWIFSYTPEFANTINIIKSRIPQDNEPVNLKLYFSRTRIANSSREMGEKSLERVFRKLGYAIVYPEKLSLDEQFRLLTHCSDFVSTEGSISHSVVFCRPGTRVTILKKSDYTNGYQSVLNEIAHLDVTYVKAHNTLVNSLWCNNPMYGPFYMCITPELEQFIGHKLFHLPLWMRPSWWWYCNRNRKIVHKIQSFFCSK